MRFIELFIVSTLEMIENHEIMKCLIQYIQ